MLSVDGLLTRTSRVAPDEDSDPLIRAIAAAPAREPPANAASASTLAPAAGDYEIVRQIGQGGMATVFEGVHRRTRQRVAIKMLRSELSRQREVVGRFFNEARAVRLIHHPSVIEIFEVAQLPDGAAYMVMELLDGETLSAHLRRAGRLGAAALPLVREVAAAVAQAHERRIIHRDLKPDNIMLVPAAAGLRVKVLDFGIAKIAQDAELAPGMGVRTRTGTVFGTPLYMSPEQCRGDGGVGAPTDVYAMGVMLHQLVAGRPPFWANAIGELLVMQIADPPPPLSTVVPDVDPALERLTLSMLDKQPERRPTMRAVLRTLDHLIAGADPARFSTPTMILSSGPVRLGKRARIVRVATAAALLALAVGAGVWMTRSRRRTAVPAPSPRTTATVATRGAPIPTPPPRPAETIVWLIKSEPTHAEVVRVTDGKLLGRTPWYVAQPATDGTVEVVVRKPGYVEQRATLDRAADDTLHLRLERARRPRAAKEEDLEVQPLQ